MKHGVVPSHMYTHFTFLDAVPMLMCLKLRDANLTLRQGSACCWAMVLARSYRLYDLGRMKVIHSRDVVFNETSMPGIQKEEEESPPKYVELEIKEEPVVEEATTLKSPSSVTRGIPANEQLGEDSTTPNSTVEESTTSTTPNSTVEESTTSNPIVSQSGLRKSTRNKRQPDRYGPTLTLLSTEQQDPSSVAEAKSSPDKVKWTNAMEMEMESLQ